MLGGSPDELNSLCSHPIYTRYLMIRLYSSYYLVELLVVVQHLLAIHTSTCRKI